MNSRMTHTFLGALGAIVATTAFASANTVDVRFVGTGKGQNVKINLNGSQQNVFAGQLKHEFSDGTGIGALLSGMHITFCTDLMNYVTSSKKEYEVVPLYEAPDPAMGVARAEAIRDMYSFAAGSQLLSSADNAFAAAFQLAIWEVAYDYLPGIGRSSLSVEDGDFAATRTNGSALSSAVLGHLNNLFDSIGTFNRSIDPGPSIMAVRSDDHQDQIVIVPLPAPSLLAGAGLLGIASIRRRRA